MTSFVSWLLSSNNTEEDEKKTESTHLPHSTHRIGATYQLHGLQQMSSMNGKLCKIIGALNHEEQRYPVFVYETGETVLIKPDNLSPLNNGTVFIRDIMVYPIKGCKGISVSSSLLTQHGVQYDREYCLLSTKTQKIITQTYKPKICWIKPSIPTEKGIQISAPGMKSSVFVPRTYDENHKVRIKYWNYKQGICGYDQGDRASQWLTQYFVHHGYSQNDSVRLILFDPAFKRKTHENETSADFVHAKNKELKQSMVSFVNEFQFLVVSEEALSALNARIKKERQRKYEVYDKQLDVIKMDRFRPNIVISSNAYYSGNFEDDVKAFVSSVNGIRFYHTKHTPRCGMPSVNQQTAKRYKEPKQTLLTYRTGEKLNYLQQQSWRDKLFFGSYFIHDKCGSIQRGELLKL